MSNVKDELREEFELQAGWRRVRAAKYPGDNLNLDAAELFDKLARSTSDIEPATLEAYRFRRHDTERNSELMLSVGFNWWPETAEEFCRRFAAK